MAPRIDASVRMSGITLEPCKHEKTIWIEFRDGDGELLNIAMFLPTELWDRVERACKAFNSEMER